MLVRSYLLCYFKMYFNVFVFLKKITNENNFDFLELDKMLRMHKFPFTLCFSEVTRHYLMVKSIQNIYDVLCICQWFPPGGGRA